MRNCFFPNLWWGLLVWTFLRKENKRGLLWHLHFLGVEEKTTAKALMFLRRTRWFCIYPFLACEFIPDGPFQIDPILNHFWIKWGHPESSHFLSDSSWCEISLLVVAGLLYLLLLPACRNSPALPPASNRWPKVTAVREVLGSAWQTGHSIFSCLWEWWRLTVLSWCVSFIPGRIGEGVTEGSRSKLVRLG